jgi:uncharacterized membrane protein
MSRLVALGFDSEAAADDFMDKLDEMGEEEIITLEDLVKVTVDENGEAKLHHKASLVSGGAVVGGFLGGAVGLLFLNPVAGAALGAAGGAAIGAASGDYGIDDDFIKQTSEALTPGSAALFMLVKESVPDRVEAEIAGTHATVIATNVSEEAEARLRAALD